MPAPTFKLRDAARLVAVTRRARFKITGVSLTHGKVTLEVDDVPAPAVEPADAVPPVGDPPR
jgi:hypothetical protein